MIALAAVVSVVVGCRSLSGTDKVKITEKPATAALT